MEKKDLNTIFLNKLELASELAHSRTLYESGDICECEDDMYEDINAEALIYKDVIQDRFNAFYDFYLTVIENQAL